MSTAPTTITPHPSSELSIGAGLLTFKMVTNLSNGFRFHLVDSEGRTICIDAVFEHGTLASLDETH